MLEFFVGVVTGVIICKIIPVIYDKRIKKPLYDKMKGVFDD